MRFFVSSQFLLAGAACLGGCSDDSGEAPGAGGDGSGANPTTAGIDLDATGSSTGGGLNGSTGGPSVETAGASGSSCALKVTDGCVGEVFQGEEMPLDIQIILDQSGSMATVIDEATGETRMDAVYRARDAF